MSVIDPIGKLYTDMVEILRTLTIKYSVRGDELETLETRSNAEQYISAYNKKDNFFTYDDYDAIDFKECDPSLSDATIYSYLNDLDSVPDYLQNKLLLKKRDYLTKNYVELNNYYRMLNGLPNLDDNRNLDKYSLIKVGDCAKELCEKYNIPKDIYIHEVEDKLGIFYINLFYSYGIIDKLIKETSNYDDLNRPYFEYLQHLGTKRIPIIRARRAKNFEILYLDNRNLMESTYKEFVRVYNQCRNYFMTTAYTYEYRNVIDRYDNFIALCIFVMTIQQLSVRSIPNAIDREFYDSRAIQILYETYGLPFNGRIDDLTQKQIVQNMNLLIQNKATDKVILDIASILGFTNIEIYEYYLMKRRLFGEDGRPIFKKKNVFDVNTGEYKEVYDNESMFDVYFQKVDIRKKDVHGELTKAINRVNYYDIVYYDPYWWEDSDLNKEIWEKEYNIMETKYLGLTIPYRLTELLFQSVYQLRMIEDKGTELSDLTLYMNKITSHPVPLVDTIMMMCAIMARKHKIPGTIYSTPSQVIHILEMLDQEIYKEDGYNEVLGFDFDMFKTEPDEEIYHDVTNKTIWRKLSDGKWHKYDESLEHDMNKTLTDEQIQHNVDKGLYKKDKLTRLTKTVSILDKYNKERDYIVMNHHDVDVDRNTGLQNPMAPTHLVDFDTITTNYDLFYGYIQTLSADSLGSTPDEKRIALNAMFKDMKALYHFLSYRLGVTSDLNEYYAIKKFYEAAYYTREFSKLFKLPENPETEKVSYTYEDWLKDNNTELYDFLQQIPDDRLYVYMEHIIYSLEQVLDEVGYLYLLNDELSPLQELLVQLIDFFRSFTTDLVDFSTVMVVDWRMENMIKLIDTPKSVTKLDVIKEELFASSYNDFISKFTVTFPMKDQILLSDYVTSHGEFPISSYFELNDKINDIYSIATVSSNINITDYVSSYKVNITVEDNLHLRDECVIIRN